MRLRYQAWKARRHAQTMSRLTTEKVDIVALVYYGGTKYEVGLFRNGQEVRCKG